MKQKQFHNIAILGTGMVGTAIGFLLKKAGHHLAAWSDLSAAHLKRAQSYVQAPGFQSASQAVEVADFILITTPDDHIGSVCAEISKLASLKGKKVFHVSGAGGLDLLLPAQQAGARIASVHPLQSFSSIDGAIARIPGSYFGITAAPGAKKTSTQMVHDLGGIPFYLSPEHKPLYHAAACIASNYLVALMSVVESIYTSIGLSEKDARKAYLPLVYGSLTNIEHQGCAGALTGPIARGDAGTIQKHLDSIHRCLPGHDDFYKELGRVTVRLAKQKGTLSSMQAKKILSLLKGVPHEHAKQNQPKNHP